MDQPLSKTIQYRGQTFTYVPKRDRAEVLVEGQRQPVPIRQAIRDVYALVANAPLREARAEARKPERPAPLGCRVDGRDLSKDRGGVLTTIPSVVDMGRNRRVYYTATSEGGRSYSGQAGIDTFRLMSVEEAKERQEALQLSKSLKDHLEAHPGLRRLATELDTETGELVAYHKPVDASVTPQQEQARYPVGFLTTMSEESPTLAVEIDGHVYSMESGSVNYNRVLNDAVAASLAWRTAPDSRYASHVLREQYHSYIERVLAWTEAEDKYLALEQDACDRAQTVLLAYMEVLETWKTQVSIWENEKNS